MEMDALYLEGELEVAELNANFYEVLKYTPKENGQYWIMFYLWFYSPDGFNRIFITNNGQGYTDLELEHEALVNSLPLLYANKDTEGEANVSNFTAYFYNFEPGFKWSNRPNDWEILKRLDYNWLLAVIKGKYLDGYPRYILEDSELIEDLTKWIKSEECHDWLFNRINEFAHSVCKGLDNVELNTGNLDNITKFLLRKSKGDTLSRSEVNRLHSAIVNYSLNYLYEYNQTPYFQTDYSPISELLEFLDTYELTHLSKHFPIKSNWKCDLSNPPIAL
jgi:hypothetical protein